MRVDLSFLPAYAAAFMLVFARIGAMVMLLPALGEVNIPVRIKLGRLEDGDKLASAEQNKPKDTAPDKKEKQPLSSVVLGMSLGTLDDAPTGLTPMQEGWAIRREHWLTPIPGILHADRDPPV